jgi:hypothetical protein
MMGEIMGSMGLEVLAEKFKDEEVERGCQSVFPMAHVPKNSVRYQIFHEWSCHRRDELERTLNF